MKLHLTVNVPNWLDRLCAWPVIVYRRRRYGYSFRRIRLTEGKFTIVEPQDFYHLNNFDWFTKKGRKCFYAVRFNNQSNKGPTMLSMHRQIMNPPAGLLVDHRNTDSLDNRRANLRLATNSQNQCNKRKTSSHTSSRYIGVSFNKHRKKWLAYITYGGKTIWLGAFDNEIDAAKAYDAAAKKYHGEFARLNFPEAATLS